MLTFNLIDTINADCKYWETIHNQGKLFHSTLRMEQEPNAVSGLYNLMLNDQTLWLGSLHEINAVVKTMIYRVRNNDFLDTI